MLVRMLYMSIKVKYHTVDTKDKSINWRHVWSMVLCRFDPCISMCRLRWLHMAGMKGYLNAILKCSCIVWVGELDHRELVGLLQVLDPLVCLACRRTMQSKAVHTHASLKAALMRLTSRPYLTPSILCTPPTLCPSHPLPLPPFATLHSLPLSPFAPSTLCPSHPLYLPHLALPTLCPSHPLPLSLLHTLRVDH